MDGKMNACEKAKSIVKEICALCESRGLTYEEVSDIPAELEREINRNVGVLKEKEKFKYLPKGM